MTPNGTSIGFAPLVSASLQLGIRGVFFGKGNVMAMLKYQYGTKKFQVGKAFVSIVWNSETKNVHLYCLGVPNRERKKGHATKLLKVLTRWADRFDYTITLTAAPYNFDGSSDLIKIQPLIKMYQKAGFQIIKRNYGVAPMIYKPKEKKCDH